MILPDGIVADAGFNASKLGKRLYQGSKPPEGDAVHRMGFDALVLCAREFQGGRYEGVQVIRCPFDDWTLTSDTWDRAMGCAQRVADLVRNGRRVLVTCHMGINRSGLVSALTIHLLTGWPGGRCTAYVQAMRPGALTNQSFTRALQERLP